MSQPKRRKFNTNLDSILPKVHKTIKNEQFSEYSNDVELIPVSESEPYIINDSFNIKNCFDDSQDFLTIKENEAFAALDELENYHITVQPQFMPQTNLSKTASQPNSKLKTGQRVLIKMPAQQLIQQHQKNQPTFIQSQQQIKSSPLKEKNQIPNTQPNLFQATKTLDSRLNFGGDLIFFIFILFQFLIFMFFLFQQIKASSSKPVQQLIQQHQKNQRTFLQSQQHQLKQKNQIPHTQQLIQQHHKNQPIFIPRSIQSQPLHQKMKSHPLLQKNQFEAAKTFNFGNF